MKERVTLHHALKLADALSEWRRANGVAPAPGTDNGRVRIWRIRSGAFTLGDWTATYTNADVPEDVVDRSEPSSMYPLARRGLR